MAISQISHTLIHVLPRNRLKISNSSALGRRLCRTRMAGLRWSRVEQEAWLALGGARLHNYSVSSHSDWSFVCYGLLLDYMRIPPRLMILGILPCRCNIKGLGSLAPDLGGCRLMNKVMTVSLIGGNPPSGLLRNRELKLQLLLLLHTCFSDVCRQK